ncbi:MAG: PAS domain S-box protein [Verrucomicrobia bacterium]|nr:PAS domain S-box protein [Verrucomicrobiota bacterium]
MEFLRQLFSAEGFMPHGHCYLWNPGVVWLHVLSDILIATAYYSIPVTLVYFVRKRKDLVFHWIFICFAVFIVACGTTHVMEIVSVWKPAYWLSGAIKALTAIASVATAILLIGLMPKALALPSHEQLRLANVALEKEVSVRKQAEIALAQYARELDEKNHQIIAAERAKSEFFANVSHELRTPLTLILAPLESLLDRAYGAVSDAQRNILKAVHNNSVRLLQMVTGLLDFSKLEAARVDVKREAVEIVALTRSVLADFEPTLKQKGLALEFRPAPAQATVEIDRYLFERILFNLLSNAVKFTPESGKINVSMTVEGHRLKLNVADTGIGIPESELPNLFQKFRQIESSATRRFEGTGLGLALVREFAQLLGGSVSVRSVVGQGSTFSVELDAPTTESTATPAARPGARLVQRYEVQPVLRESTVVGATSRPKVLIAEDNVELAVYVSSLLGDFCDTCCVQEGEQALQSMREWQPDLLLADVMMPKRDGLSLCRELKSDPAHSRTPVILLTALTHREALLQGWEAGADEYLFKPFHPQELVARVRSMLRLARSRREAEALLAGANDRLEREVRERTQALTRANAALEAEIAERQRVEHEIRQLTIELEQRVRDRTARLEAAKQELENEIAERKLTEALLRESEERFRLLVLGVRDYAIFGLDAEGRVAGWNAGAERIKGYQAGEIIGKAVATFYAPEDLARGRPEQLLKAAIENGRVEDEGWRVRKDGTRFWANVVITALRDDAGQLRGFAKITRDITERKRAEKVLQENEAALRERTAQLEASNKELEAFSYSVSHDLRAPLRAIDGFSQALQEDVMERLDENGKKHLARIRDATQRMGQLIDGLLALSRLSRAEINREAVNLSGLAKVILDDLSRADAGREFEFVVQPGLTAHGDPRLLRVALDNLLGNAWKFTRKKPRTRVEFGMIEQSGQRAFFVRDNGAGFDMTYQSKLFGAFQRLHPKSEFEGTGIGLATVQRIIHRHGGRTWAEGAPDQGATFYFTLPTG